MKIKFVGAARCVTGSSYLVETGSTKFLVDCGMRHGSDAKNWMDEGEFPYNPADIDFVVLTHAHIDHSGYLPLLYKKGFTGRIYATTATSELCSIMLPDSGHIQEMEIEWKNRKLIRAGKKPIDPLYTVQHANECLALFECVEYGDMVQATPDIRLRYKDAGHLLGSGSVAIWVKENDKEEKVVFSGDIGNKDKPIIKDPTYFDEADYVVMESTYGNRYHDDLEKTVDQLRHILKDAIKRGGNIVIPAFAVGRTQEVLYDLSLLLNDKSVPGLEKMPVYIDSPLGIKATQIFETCFLNYYDIEAMALKKQGVEFLHFDTLNVAETADESKAINFLKHPAIIISSSGMCDAGRIKHHLKHNLWKNDATVIFVGYQAIGTTGRSIIDGSDSVKIFGDRVMVNATIERVEGFSGHADKKGLLEWVEKFEKPPKKVFVTHGEEQVALSFGNDLKALGFDVEVPRLGDMYDMRDQAMMSDMAAVRSIEKVKADEFNRALSVVKYYMSLNENKGDAVDKRQAFASDLNALLDKWEIREKE